MDAIQTQAVSFDVGGTLIEPCPSVGSIYAAVAADNGFPSLPSQQIDQQFREAWQRKEDFQYTEPAWLEVVVQSFHELLPREACESLFPKIYRRFTQADVWRVHDDVPATLDDLAGRGFRLALISNWDNRLRPLLNELKLASFFETVTISCEVGFTKPSSIPFEQTLKKLGLSPEAMVHVGDSRHEDINGAEAAGITGILIRRDHPPGTRCVATLSQLSSILVEDW